MSLGASEEQCLMNNSNASGLHCHSSAISKKATLKQNAEHVRTPYNVETFSFFHL